MNNKLFDCNVKYLYRYFDGFEYPWDVVNQIKSYIKNIFELKPCEYKFISDNILVGENVEISDKAEIIGPAIIGSNSKIRVGAYIRQNVIIGENCVIGNSSEIKNSLLLNNVQVPHYNYVGDSILGNNVHLGAGVICSNLKTDKSTIKANGVDTKMKKLGAMLGDGVDIGCGCVLNPGTIIGKNTTAYPLNSLRGVYNSGLIIKSKDNIIERRID